MGKDVEGRFCGIILGAIPTSGWAEESYENLQDTQSLGWYLNLGRPEYQTERDTYLNILHYAFYVLGSRHISVDIATGYGLDDRRVGVRISVGLRISLLHVVYTGSGGHPNSYSMGTAGKAAGS
jgi:hypothetical protein